MWHVTRQTAHSQSGHGGSTGRRSAGASGNVHAEAALWCVHVRTGQKHNMQGVPCSAHGPDDHGKGLSGATGGAGARVLSIMKMTGKITRFRGVTATRSPQHRRRHFRTCAGLRGAGSPSRDYRSPAQSPFCDRLQVKLDSDCAVSPEWPRPPLPDLLGPVLGELHVEMPERLHHSRGALHVRVVDHDVPWESKGAVRWELLLATHVGNAG